MNQLIKTTLTRFLSINFTSFQTISDTKTTQDTSQTSFRHPSDIHGALNVQSMVNERKGTNQLKQYSMFLPLIEFRQSIWHDSPPGSIQSHLNNLQTPSRHLPDNPNSINVGVVKCIGRNFLPLNPH